LAPIEVYCCARSKSCQHRRNNTFSKSIGNFNQYIILIKYLLKKKKDEKC
jgi:hypothetical protein